MSGIDTSTSTNTDDTLINEEFFDENESEAVNYDEIFKNNGFDDAPDKSKETQKNETDKPTETPQADSEAQKTEALEVKLPQSWAESDKEKFKTLSPDIQDIILKREEQFHKQITTNDNYRNTGRKIEAIYDNYGDIIGQGHEPTEIVGELMEVARILVKGTPEQKANLLVNEAQKHGIDLGKYLEYRQNQDPKVSQLETQLAQMQNMLKQFQQSSTIQAREQADKAVSDFLEDTVNYPYANDVLEDVIDLISTGKYTLDTAYKKAVRLNDKTFSTIAQKEQEKKAQEAIEQAKKAKANSFTVKNNGATIPRTGAKTEAELNQTYDEIAERHGLK